MWFIVLDGGKFDYVEKLIMFIFIKKFVDNLIKDREKIIIYVHLIKYLPLLMYLISSSRLPLWWSPSCCFGNLVMITYMSIKSWLSQKIYFAVRTKLMFYLKTTTIKHVSSISSLSIIVELRFLLWFWLPNSSQYLQQKWVPPAWWYWSPLWEKSKWSL